MRRSWLIVLIFAVLLPWAPHVRAQTRAAPLYALPADGTWVEYDWESFTPGGAVSQAGTLRIASVASSTVQCNSHRWVEITREILKGPGVKRRIRRLLVDERALAASRPLSEAVVSASERRNDGSLTPMPRDRIEQFVGLGIRGDDDALREVCASEPVQTGLGTFRTRHVSARGGSASRVIEYHGWLTPESPYGWARMEIRESAANGPPRTIFRATASRTGQSAQRVADGHPPQQDK
jgi:hypothetical protein